MADDKPIIVIKKKGGHAAHHGGAWKVAYADFVTAMMCFFMVMWLINSAEAPTRQSIASYFRKPGIFDQGSGTPLMQGEAGIVPDGALQPRTQVEVQHGAQSLDPQLEEGKKEVKGETGDDSIEDQRITKLEGREHTDTAPQELKEEATPVPTTSPVPEAQAAGALFPPGTRDQAEQDTGQLEQLAQEIQQKIQASPEFVDLLGKLDVKMDSDGLNIEIMDTEKTSMFNLGSATILSEAQAAFSKIAQLINDVPNEITIVGHTDARPFSKRRGGYSNWELSADRANAARRLLEQNGIPPERITDVSGRAEKEPKVADPLAAANRRISLKMKFAVRKDIDLAKEPDSLDKALQEPPPAEATHEPEKAGEPQKVHDLTPKQILSNVKKQKNAPVRVPETQPADTAATPNQEKKKELIFDNNPVIGPFDVINNLR